MAEASEWLENPFTPTFGEVPAYLAGRSALLSELRRAYKGSRRHPSLTLALTGARGSGKTALMAAAAEEAERSGWIAVRTVALPRMLDDVLISARRESAHLVSAQGGRKLSGVELGHVVAVEWDNSEPLTNWRNEMTLLLDQLEEVGAGLLITVDEVQPTLDEMIQLAAVYQLFVTEGRRVALLLAGLPHNMLALEKDKRVSFLRRAQKRHLGRIADFEIAQAMERTVKLGGREIEPEALERAVAAAAGFPFMMQLVGFRMWDAGEGTGKITLTDAEQGAFLASAELTEGVVKTTYEGLSKGDRAFLRAMTELETPTSPGVAKKMGKTNSYATQYKNRLLGQGVIEESGDGRLSFQMPLMREYVLAHLGGVEE